jgi:PEP-CTERM motif
MPRNLTSWTSRIMRAHLAVPALGGLLLLAAPAVRANDISFVDSFRNASYEQTGNGNSLTLNGYFFSADLVTNTPNPYASVSLIYPGPGSPANLPQISPTDYGMQTGFLSKAALDADFPMGVYTFKSNTGDTTGYDYEADDYAQSNPFLTGTDYSDLQGMNATQGFTFHFSPFVTGNMAASSFIFFTVFDQTTSTQAFTGGFLPANTASLFMPANTLTPGDSYTFELDFSNRDILNLIGDADFPPEVAFDVRSDGAFIAAAAAPTPEPGTFGLFGVALLAAAGLRRRVSNLLQ